jgi:hypothetical protein
MKTLPTTETALIIRTDFSDQATWETLTAVLREPEDPFMFNMELLEDRDFDGATAGQLLNALPDDYPHSFIVVADSVSMSESDHPLLLIDLLEDRGREFRAVAAQVPTIDNSLSIGNMSFEEFADLIDETGVFRGIPEM